MEVKVISLLYLNFVNILERTVNRYNWRLSRSFGGFEHGRHFNFSLRAQLVQHNLWVSLILKKYVSNSGVFWHERLIIWNISLLSCIVLNVIIVFYVILLLLRVVEKACLSNSLPIFWVTILNLLFFTISCVFVTLVVFLLP